MLGEALRAAGACGRTEPSPSVLGAGVEWRWPLRLLC